MSLREDGPLAWRWLNVQMPTTDTVFVDSPRFNYQGREWFLRCFKQREGIILFLWCSSGFQRRLWPFNAFVQVQNCPNMRHSYSSLNDHFNNMSTCNQFLLILQTSRLEQSIPRFSQNRMLSFKIKFTNLNTALGPNTPPLTSMQSLLPNSSQPRVHSETADASVQTSLTSDSMSCLDRLLGDYGKMLEESSDFDVEILCEGRFTRAHKNILSSRSPVIKKMLHSDMVEGKTGVVHIRDLSADTLPLFLSYLYTGKLEDTLTHDAAVCLYKAGDMYAVETLVRRCSQFLRQNLTIDSACDLLVMADAYNDEDLKKFAIQYILKEKIHESGDNWQAFRKSHPTLALEVMECYVKLLTAEPPRKKLCA